MPKQNPYTYTWSMLDFYYHLAEALATIPLVPTDNTIENIEHAPEQHKFKLGANEQIDQHNRALFVKTKSHLSLKTTTNHITESSYFVNKFMDFHQKQRTLPYLWIQILVAACEQLLQRYKDLDIIELDAAAENHLFSFSYPVEEEDIQDPITYDEYNYPIAIACGHIYNLGTIFNIKYKCALCVTKLIDINNIDFIPPGLVPILLNKPSMVPNAITDYYIDTMIYFAMLSSGRKHLFTRLGLLDKWEEKFNELFTISKSAIDKRFLIELWLVNNNDINFAINLIHNQTDIKLIESALTRLQTILNDRTEILNKEIIPFLKTKAMNYITTYLLVPLCLIIIFMINKPQFNLQTKITLSKEKVIMATGLLMIYIIGNLQGFINIIQLTIPEIIKINHLNKNILALKNKITQARNDMITITELSEETKLSNNPNYSLRFRSNNNTEPHQNALTSG